MKARPQECLPCAVLRKHWKMGVHGLKPSVLPQKLKPLSGAGKHSKDFKCWIFGIDCSWPLDRKRAAPFRDDLCVFPLHLLAPQRTLLCLFALPPAFPTAPLYCLGIGFPGRPFSLGLLGSLVTILSHQVHPAFSPAPKHRPLPVHPSCAALGWSGRGRVCGFRKSVSWGAVSACGKDLGGARGCGVKKLLE